MTKVLPRTQGLRLAVAICVMIGGLHAADMPPDKPAEALYLKLGQVGLDAQRVYQVRGASLDRSAVHISLEDGTIGFTQDVMGRITGAFFEGDGEVLITPPTDVERRTMSLFTGMAILEEHFSTAYFRFNDDVLGDLRPDLRATDNKQEFIDQWAATATNLAQVDAMRLLTSFSQLLPVRGSAMPSEVAGPHDRYLHARLQGNTLGVFDVYFDSTAVEQIQVGQAKPAENGSTFYDVWAAFSPAEALRSRTDIGSSPSSDTDGKRQDWIRALHFTIKTDVNPPKQIHAHANVDLEVRESGSRALLFELSRFLQIESVRLDGQPVEFIHNPSIEGTQLARTGNDIVAVILPEPARTGQKIDLEFIYGGEVLAEAGSGLLYVGARGTWYPNRGLAMADFDLEFRYPAEWTLLATGKPVPVLNADAKPTEQVSHWVSERPIPVAGFNLGRYKLATSRAGDVLVETYATQGVERDFPSPTANIQVVERSPTDPSPRRSQLFVPSHPSPAQHGATVGESAARAIQYYSERFGPYPYSRLELTQMPGRDSQGWPGLIFLSSFAFLDSQDREQLHFEPVRIVLQQMIPAHETAHQWWGDLVMWSGYRDQWFSEGLANYCALMMVQEKDPAGFRLVMEKFRRDLVERNQDGMAPKDAGPVTLGIRLLSSRFPEGYEAISYGRGAWLFHMLRTMLNDAELQEGHKSGTEEPFVRALRKIRQRYEGKSISTRELLDVFAEDIPPSLQYEGKKSLDWFMDGWINGTALPSLELKAVKIAQKGKGTVVSGTILQKNAPKDLVTSVPVYAVMPGKRTVLLERVFADGEESSFRVSAPAGVHKIVLDPNETILTSPK